MYIGYGAVCTNVYRSLCSYNIAHAIATISLHFCTTNKGNDTCWNAPMSPKVQKLFLTNL